MPIVVTTSSRTAVSASTWNPRSTPKLPAGIHVQSLISKPCSPNGSAWVRAGTMTASAMTQTAITMPTGTIAGRAAPNRHWSRRPNSAVNAKPRIGSSGMSGISSG